MPPPAFLPGPVTAPSGSAAYRPEKMVRTDPASRSIESYLSNPLKAAAVSGEQRGGPERGAYIGYEGRN